MLSPLPSDPDPVYDEHTRLKAIRERMTEMLNDSIQLLRDAFPGDERILAEVLDGQRAELMREHRTVRLAGGGR